MNGSLHSGTSENRALTKLLEEGGGPDGLYHSCLVDNFHAFVVEAWPHVDPDPFIDGPHIKVLCSVLERVTRGELTRVLVNIPPRSSKSLLISVLWPAWCWAQPPKFFPDGKPHPLSGPRARFISASYDEGLSTRDNLKMRNLILSPWYRRMFPHVVLDAYQGEKTRYNTTAGGFRQSTSVRGMATGEGADAILCFPADALVLTEFGPVPIRDIIERRDSTRVWSFNRDTGEMELKPVIGWHRNPGRKIVEVCLSDGTRLRCTPDHRIWTARGMVRADELVTTDVLPRLAGLGGPGAVEADARVEGLMTLSVSDVIGPAPVGKVREDVVAGVAVKVADVGPSGALANECQHNEVVQGEALCLAVGAQVDPVIPASVGCFQEPAGDDELMSLPVDFSRLAPHAGEVGDKVIRITGDRTPLFVREFGYSHETYCLTVADNHTMVVDGCITSNCDDPHNVKQAESPPIREETIRWYREVLPTRLNNRERGAIITVMQRVHERDVSGYILSSGVPYEHICLPALYEPDHPHVCKYDWRTEAGQPLWPDRPGFDVKGIEQLALEMGSYAAAGQLQQRPAPRGGGMFKEHWFPVVDALPAKRVKVRAWDLAATVQKYGTDPDWTVGVLMSRDEAGFFTIEDVIRLRGGPAEVERAIRNTALLDGKDVRIRLPQDPGQAGKAQAGYLIRSLAGFNARAVPPTGSKETRAGPFAAQAEAGNVRLLRAPWNRIFLDEMTMFPAAAHDDQVDAATDAFNELASGPAKRAGSVEIRWQS